MVYENKLDKAVHEALRDEAHILLLNLRSSCETSEELERAQNYLDAFDYGYDVIEVRRRNKIDQLIKKYGF